MNQTLPSGFKRLLKLAVFTPLAVLCVMALPWRASAQGTTYNFVEYQPFSSSFIVTGDIVVDLGNNIIGGSLSFASTTPIPASSWYQASWNGSYLSAGFFGTPEGTVLATGPGQPQAQIFNSLGGSGTISGNWVAPVPEPTTLSLLLTIAAAFGFGAGGHASRFSRHKPIDSAKINAIN